jgi:hypothetical protein
MDAAQLPADRGAGAVSLFYGDAFTLGFPRGSGRQLNLAQIAEELWGRLATLFLLNGVGRRPALGMEVRVGNIAGELNDRLRLASR